MTKHNSKVKRKSPKILNYSHLAMNLNALFNLSFAACEHFTTTTGAPAYIFWCTMLIIFRLLFLAPFFSIIFKIDVTKYSGESCLGSAIGFTHGLVATLVGIQLLSTSPTSNLSEVLSVFDASWQLKATTLVSFSTGYMIEDFFFMTVDGFIWGWNAEPMLQSFILHHVACLIYLSSVAVVGAGHVGFLILVVMGEVTNSFQNSRSISIQALMKEQTDTNKGFFLGIKKIMTCILAVLFFFVRMVCGPFVILFFSNHFFISGERSEAVPLWIAGVWTFIAIAIVHGSIPFSMTLLGELKEILGTGMGKEKEKKN